jgi:DeoR family fructose operon transcriptional repressor
MRKCSKRTLLEAAVMPRSSLQAERRRRELARSLKSGRPVHTAEEARRFGVCQMTIRRDLATLASAGVAVRNYGGAVGTGRVTFEFAFSRRHHLHLPEKGRIGAAAARRIRPGQTVFIDTGTTTLQIARALARTRLPCTVVTSSLVIAAELWLRPRTELILLGGRRCDGSARTSPSWEATAWTRSAAASPTIGRWHGWRR